MKFSLLSQITIEPDSEFESDVCEQTKSRLVKIYKLPRQKRRKLNNQSDGQDPMNASSDDEFNDFNEIDMTDSQPASEEDSVPIIKELPSINGNTTDNEDTFGAMVSSKLLLMSPLQRLMAQKIITEILFTGQMGMLKSSFVAGYMKNSSIAATKNTNTNVVSSSGCLPSMHDDDGDGDRVSDDNCDPLMLQVNPGKISVSKAGTFDFVNSEIAWSSDDDDES